MSTHLLINNIRYGKKFPITLTDVDDFTITEDKYENA